MQPTPKTCNCQGGWKCPTCVDAFEQRIAELKAEIKRLRQEITWLGGYPPEWEKDDE